jgi:hypothetical protein
MEFTEWVQRFDCATVKTMTTQRVIRVTNVGARPSALEDLVSRIALTPSRLDYPAASRPGSV